MIEKSQNIFENVVVRIPPSPTGNLHIGTARTALFNYLFARQNKGKVILRMEDTDTQRSTKGFEENIIEGLNWLGLSWDNKEIYRQSERYEIYKKYLEKMLKKGSAYVSKEEIKEEDQRSEVIRFKNPNEKITFNDVIRGEITFDTTELGDFIIAKSVEEPLYHLAVVIDDLEMKISHVIRGEDHISNTPRQILLQRAIGAPTPIYAHIPLILSADKSKMSKRHGATALTLYRDRGYLPEAIINFLALLGWNPGTEKEIFSLEDLIKEFDLSRVQKGGAVFNEVKLKSINRYYIKQLPDEKIAKIIKEVKPDVPKEKIFSITPLIKERIDTLGDIKNMLNSGEFDFAWSEPVIEDPGRLLWKSDDKETAKKHLEEISKMLGAGQGKEEIMEYAEKQGKGSVLWPLRYALSGQEKSPDPFTILGIIGKHETQNRIKKAVTLLS